MAPANAHHTLANIALRQNQPEVARREAKLAADADPTLPVPQLISGLIAYERGQFAEALPLLMQAREAYGRRTLQTNDLNFYIGDCLARLERYAEAERYFLDEVRLYPQNTRARAGLALLYQATGRPSDAERTIEEMIRAAPTALSFERAASLWSMFGRADKAAEMRALARGRR